jgi:hypothetical protein
MTTELALLLSVFMFVVIGVFRTPTRTFEEAGPRLGLRLEKQMETGTGFNTKSQKTPRPISWVRKP